MCVGSVQRWAQIHQKVFSYKLQILTHQMYLNKIQNTAVKNVFN